MKTLNEYEGIIFEETQRFTQWWIRFLIGASTIFVWYGFVQQIFFDRPFGSNPAPDKTMIVIWLAFGILLPVFMFSCKLQLQVRRDGFYYRFKPFHLKMHVIRFDEIRFYEAVTYRPIIEYGGWGLRYGIHGRAFNISGNRGLRIELMNGKRILFGSAQPEELKLNLDTMMGWQINK